MFRDGRAGCVQKLCKNGEASKIVSMNTNEQSWHDKFAELETNIHVWWRQQRQYTLTEIEEAVDAELAQLRQQLVEDLLGEMSCQEPDMSKPLCPACQEVMKPNGKKKRRLRSKEDQVIELNREQMRCPACGMTLFPPG